MKVIKVLALSLIGLLLFLSLSFLGLALMLNSTVLNPDFAVRELDRLDVYSFAEELLREQMVQVDVPAAYQPYVDEVMNKTLHDLRPWAREQVNIAVNTCYDYFTGRSRGLDLTISLQPVEDSLKRNLRETVLAALPPELQGLPQAQIDSFLDVAYQQFAQIPPTLDINLETLDSDTRASLEQVRQYVGYFQLGYKLLIAFIFLLILGVVLMCREVRESTRSLGITFLASGVITYLSSLAIRYLVGSQLEQAAMPADFQTLLPRLVADLLAPLGIYCIVLAAIGVALLVVSFVYRPRTAAV